MLYPLLMGAALLAAAPLDARHAALYDMLTAHDPMGCTQAQLRAVAADASIESVGRVDGDDVVIAHLNGGCLSGAHNSPVFALRLTGGKPRVLMTSLGYEHILRAATPLPRIVVRSHDSAMISNEETYAYRDGRYVDIENARVRNDTGARKVDVAVRFAPGASSAQLHGSASRDWDDVYTFGAEKGQQLVVDGVSSRGSVALTLFFPRAGVSNMSAGVPVTLPETGTYVLRVVPAAERAVPYALRLAITSTPAAAPANNSSADAAAKQPVPDAALMRWALSIPEVRCVPFAFGAWSNTRTDKDTSGVPTTLVAGEKFFRSALSVPVKKITLVAGVERSDSDRYYLARVPSAGAAVMEWVGTGDEDDTAAVIAHAGAPPRAVVPLPSALRTRSGLGLGSTRSAVEAALGPGRSKAACGFDVVHYSQSGPRASVAELWFFYRGGAVTAITFASGV